MIHFLTPAGQDLIPDYLSLWGKELVPRVRILDYESLSSRKSFDPGTYVLTSLDRLSPAQERVLAEVHARLSVESGFRFLNHPTRTRMRLDLLEELARLKWNDFRAFRASADLDGLRYPVFVRSERAHDGALSPLLRSPREVRTAIGRALFKGYRFDDLLVVEFCDTAGADGLYRRYAAFIVGDRILARNLERGPDWMAKRYQTEFSESQTAEEREFVFSNPHEAQLREIFRIAGIEYGRIDYAVRDGRVQTWEINVAPTIGRGQRPTTKKIPDRLQPIRRISQEHFYRLFQEAWEAVDLPSDGQPVPVAFTAESAAAARPAKALRKPWLVRSIESLRPAMPLLLALARPLFPLVGALARASSRRR